MIPEWAKTAKVGDKVVCVAKYLVRPGYEEIQPVVGGVYTIREVLHDDYDCIAFCFEEIINRKFRYIDGFSETYFWANKLRPVQTRKTDISIFHEILKSVSERISA